MNSMTLDSYKCCADNKIAMRGREGLQGGDSALLHFISRKVLLSEMFT